MCDAVASLLLCFSITHCGFYIKLNLNNQASFLSSPSVLYSMRFIHTFFIRQLSKATNIPVFKGGWTFWWASDPGRGYRLFYSSPSDLFSVLLRPVWEGIMLNQKCPTSRVNQRAIIKNKSARCGSIVSIISFLCYGFACARRHLLYYFTSNRYFQLFKLIQFTVFHDNYFTLSYLDIFFMAALQTPIKFSKIP